MPREHWPQRHPPHFGEQLVPSASTLKNWSWSSAIPFDGSARIIFRCGVVLMWYMRTCLRSRSPLSIASVVRNDPLTHYPNWFFRSWTFPTVFMTVVMMAHCSTPISMSTSPAGLGMSVSLISGNCATIRSLLTCGKQLVIASMPYARISWTCPFKSTSGIQYSLLFSAAGLLPTLTIDKSTLRPCKLSRVAALCVISEMSEPESQRIVTFLSLHVALLVARRVGWSCAFTLWTVAAWCDVVAFSVYAVENDVFCHKPSRLPARHTCLEACNLLRYVLFVVNS